MCFEIGVKQGRIPSLCLVVFSVGDVLECFWEVMGNLSTFQFGSVKKMAWKVQKLDPISWRKWCYHEQVLEFESMEKIIMNHEVEEESAKIEKLTYGSRISSVSYDWEVVSSSAVSQHKVQATSWNQWCTQFSRYQWTRNGLWWIPNQGRFFWMIRPHSNQWHDFSIGN